MRKLLFIALSFCLALKLEANHPVTTPPEEPKKSFSQKLATIKIRDLEKITGKRFSLKEKLSLKLAQWKIKHALKKEKGDKAETALTLSIIGLSCVVVGIFLPYIIIAALPCAIIGLVMGYNVRKTDKENKKAKTAITLSWITLGLMAALIVLAIIILSTFSFSFE